MTKRSERSANQKTPPLRSPVVRSDSHDDRVVPVLMIVIHVSAISAFALLLHILLRMSNGAASEPPAIVCGPDQLTIDGVCVEKRESVNCQPFERRETGCVCSEPYAWIDNACVHPDPQVRACHEPDVKAILAELKGFDEECKKVTGEKDSTSCSTENFKEFFISEGKFKNILRVATHTVFIYFESGKPEITTAVGDSQWVRDHGEYIREQLKPLQEEALRSSYTFVIGRASRSVGSNNNGSYTQYRMKLAKENLPENLPGKVLEFPIGDEVQLKIPQLLEMKRNDVLWSEEAQNWFSSTLEDVGRKQKLPAKELELLENVINQSVMIVLVNCEPEPAPDAKAGKDG